MSNKVLLVEDDAMIASGLRYALEQEGYSVAHCGTIQASKEALRNCSFDLALHILCVTNHCLIRTQAM